jgi:hypothetical protein
MNIIRHNVILLPRVELLIRFAIEKISVHYLTIIKTVHSGKFLMFLLWWKSHSIKPNDLVITENIDLSSNPIKYNLMRKFFAGSVNLLKFILLTSAGKSVPKTSDSADRSTPSICFSIQSDISD